MIRSKCCNYQFVKFTLWSQPCLRLRWYYFIAAHGLRLTCTAEIWPKTSLDPGQQHQVWQLSLILDGKNVKPEATRTNKSRFEYIFRLRNHGLIVLCCIDSSSCRNVWEYISRVCRLCFSFVWRFAFRPCGWRCQSLGLRIANVFVHFGPFRYVFGWNVLNVLPCCTCFSNLRNWMERLPFSLQSWRRTFGSHCIEIQYDRTNRNQEMFPQRLTNPRTMRFARLIESTW